MYYVQQKVVQNKNIGISCIYEKFIDIRNKQVVSLSQFLFNLVNTNVFKLLLVIIILVNFFNLLLKKKLNKLFLI